MKNWSFSSKFFLIILILDFLVILFCFWQIFGPPSARVFTGTKNLAIDREGNIYVAGGSCIKKFNSDLTFAGVWAGCDSSDYISPKKLAVGPQGELYGLVLNPLKFEDLPKLVKLDANGKVLLSWNIEGNNESFPENVPAFTVDKNGMIFVEEFILNISKDGDIYSYKNTGQKSIQEFDNTGKTVGKWLSDQDIDFIEKSKVFARKDTTGNIYTLEGNDIIKSGPDGKVLTTWSGKTSDASLNFLQVSTQDKIFTLQAAGPVLEAYVTVYDSNGKIIGTINGSPSAWTILSYPLLFLTGFGLFVLAFVLLLLRNNDIKNQKRKLQIQNYWANNTFR